MRSEKPLSMRCTPSQKFSERRLWNSCNVCLTDDGPFSSFWGSTSSASSLYVSLPLSCGRHLAIALSRKIVERFLIIRLSPSLLWTTFSDSPFEEDRRALPLFCVSLLLSCGRHLAMALSRKIVERFLILDFSPSLLWTTFSDGPFEEDRRALPHYTFLSFSPVDAILRWPFRGRSSSASSLYISLLLSCRRHFAVALSRKIVERFLIIQFSPFLLWTTFCGGPFEEDCRALPHSVSLPLSCGRHSAEDCLAWWRPPPHLTPPLPVSMLLYVHRDRGWVCKRVSLYMSECVCVCVFAVPVYFHFFLLLLVNDLSLVSRCFYFGNAYDFVFVAVCFFLMYAFVFYVYCRVLPDVLLLMFFHVGYMKEHQ